MKYHIVRNALYEEIVKALIEQIKNGAWEPGDRLPSEAEFATLFEVSRNCIREALKAMGLSGIVYSRPGQGTFLAKDALLRISNYELVSTLSEGVSLHELMETRVIVESQLAGLAAERVTEEDKARITVAYNKLNEELLARSDKGLSSNPSEAGLSFHMEVAKAARNRLLLQFLDSIKSGLESQRSRMMLKHEDVELMIEDHSAIYNAVIDGDSNAASKAMHEHLIHSYDTILSNYDV